jgi:hypothetical protein
MQIKKAASQDVQAVRRLVREAYAQWVSAAAQNRMLGGAARYSVDRVE